MTEQGRGRHAWVVHCGGVDALRPMGPGEGSSKASEPETGEEAGGREDLSEETNLN